MAGSIYGVSQVTEITPSLYLTSVYGATRENIIKRGCTLLVNAAQELPKQEIAGVESIKLFLDDTPYAIINVYFDRIADKIHEHVLRGGRSLVHCVLGVSRSTSLVLAYLMKYKNMSLKNAFDAVSARRPCVRPNPGFWRQLLDYEKRLVNQQLNRHETTIPITIISSSTGLKPSSGSSSSQSKSTSNHSSNLNLNTNPYDYDPSRPYSASRYGSSSYLYGNERGSSNISKLYRSVNGNPSNSVRMSNDYSNNSNDYNNSLSHSYSSSTVNPTSQHRTSLIVNDVNASRYTIKPSTFSTTYRSSYGRL